MNIWRNSNANSGLNALELSVSDSGYCRLDADWFSEDVCSPYSRLYLVESGEGVLEHGGQILTMVPGFVYLVPAGLRFSYRCEDSMTKLFFHVTVLKPDGYDLFRGFDRIGVASLPPERLRTILRLYRVETMANNLLLKQHIYQILGDFLETYQFGREELTVYSRHVQETILFIRENLSAKLNVEELAQRLFVSKSFLSEKFRQEVGVTLGKYIDDQLMAAAQWQLLKTKVSIGEISDALGYCDQFYFSRRFKQLCGETPLQYRKKIRAVDHWT